MIIERDMIVDHILSRDIFNSFEAIVRLNSEYLNSHDINLLNDCI